MLDIFYVSPTPKNTINTIPYMHFCVSSISAWWFVWSFCYNRNVLPFPTHVICTRHSMSERFRTYSWFQPGYVKFILFCKYSCIPLNQFPYVSMATHRQQAESLASFQETLSRLRLENEEMKLGMERMRSLQSQSSHQQVLLQQLKARLEDNEWVILTLSYS